MKSILLKCLSVLKMFGDYFRYSDRLTYTAKVLSLRSMKDQIPYLTKVHELRGNLDVFTQVISRNVSRWLAERSGLRMWYLERLQKTLLCLFCVCVFR